MLEFGGLYRGGSRWKQSTVAFLLGAALFLVASTHMCDKGIKWLEGIAPFLGGGLCSTVVFFVRPPVRRLLLLAMVLSLPELYLWLIHR
jgi:hypothetical protein